MKKQKIVALLLSMVMLFVSAAAMAEQPSYTPGTYEASAAGMNGPVSLSVTFDENSILEIAIGAHAETLSISDPAFENVPKDIVDYQTLNVDAASGATMTSNAIINAVADAVVQAGGDAEALKAAPKPVKEAQADAEMSADIVVVGSGMAGVSAALEAANQGKNVVLIEKQAAYGGSTAQSGGAICHTGEEFTAEDYAEWLIEMGHGHENINEDLIRAIANLAEDSMKFVREAGVVIDHPVRETLQGGKKVSYLVSTRKTVELGAGGLIIQPMIDKLSSLDNVTLMNNTAAESLITNEAGAVVGVNAKRADGSKVTLYANSVIMAVGGYDRNPEYMAKMAPGFTAPYSISGTGNTGDGIAMVEAVGAHVNYDVPMAVDGIMLLPVATTGDFMLINAEGKRFISETAPNIQVMNAIAKQPEGIHYYVYDANELFEFVNTADRAALEAGAASGVAIEAATIEELAGKLGIDAAALTATVERYNSFVGGTDEDFGKDMSKVVPFENGPFYAQVATPMIMTAYCGPEINENCQVLDSENNVIEGLYAAGEFAATNWTGQDTIGHGMSIQDAMSTGRIAAKHASSK